MRLVSLLLLAACVDYNLEGNKDVVEGFDSGDSPPEDTATDSDSGPIEETDTEVLDCDLLAPAATTTAILEDCEGNVPPVIKDPWNVHVEWDYNSGGTGVIVMPAVGNLTDDDGDGDVDENDDPDVAFTEWSGNLTILDGLGSVILKVPGYNGNAGVTIADVTGDGVPEVIALQTTGKVAAVEADGTVVWTSATLSGIAYYPQPAVADLDNDGDAEVVFDNAVLDGRTGATLARLTASLTTSWRTPVIADLDLDGTREILLGNVTFAPDGRALWTNQGTGAGNFAAVADVDGDPEGEAIFVSGSNMYVYDSDGTKLSGVSIPGSNPGPPSVADFDGDGQVEVAIPANTTISMFEVSGARVWSSTMQDNSGLAGCSGYDVNGDGAYEVLFADELALRIYDGASGTILYEDPTHDSQTLWEYPVIADVDHDGSAEIAVASNLYHGGALGVTLFGHDGDGWPASGPTWGTHDFAVTNLGQDGSVPTSETPSWQVHNVFRARPSVDSPGSADLYVELGELCVTGCDEGDEAQVSWQVGNQGAVASGTATLTFYALWGSTELVLGTAAIPEIEPGDVPAGGVFTFDPVLVAGANAYGVRLDDIRSSECDDTNHDARANVAICP